MSSWHPRMPLRFPQSPGSLAKVTGGMERKPEHPSVRPRRLAPLALQPGAHFCQCRHLQAGCCMKVSVAWELLGVLCVTPGGIANRCRAVIWCQVDG